MTSGVSQSSTGDSQEFVQGIYKSFSLRFAGGPPKDSQIVLPRFEGVPSGDSQELYQGTRIGSKEIHLAIHRSFFLIHRSSFWDPQEFVPVIH